MIMRPLDRPHRRSDAIDDPIRRQLVLGGCSLVATAPGVLLFAPQKAEAAGPVLTWLLRTGLRRFIAREQMLAVGRISGIANRAAVMGSTAARGWGLAGTAAGLGGVAMGGLALTELGKFYVPGWVEALRNRVADFTVSAHSSPAERQMGISIDRGWHEPANLVYGAQFVSPDAASGHAAPEVFVAAQSAVVEGERIPGFASTLPVDRYERYAVVPFAYDIDRQRYWVEHGDIPPSIIQVR